MGNLVLTFNNLVKKTNMIQVLGDILAKLEKPGTTGRYRVHRYYRKKIKKSASTFSSAAVKAAAYFRYSGRHPGKTRCQESTVPFKPVS